MLGYVRRLLVNYLQHHVLKAPSNIRLTLADRLHSNQGRSSVGVVGVPWIWRGNPEYLVSVRTRNTGMVVCNATRPRSNVGRAWGSTCIGEIKSRKQQPVMFC